MSWKDWPAWLKFGVALPLIVLILFLVNGLIVSIINGGKCNEIENSLGTGTYVTKTFQGCFKINNNFMTQIVELPRSIIFYSTGIMNSFYNYITNGYDTFIGILFNYSLSYLFLTDLPVSLILYFLIGALIGFIINKIKKRSKK